MTDQSQQWKALSERATRTPWSYRPREHDDWGIVRAPRDEVQGWEPIIAQIRHPDFADEETLNEHRRAKTDPWAANAQLVVFAVNNFTQLLKERDEAVARAERAEVVIADILGVDSGAGTWMDAVAPLIQRFEVASKFDQQAVHNSEGAAAIAALMRAMAEKMDCAIEKARATLSRTQEKV